MTRDASTSSNGYFYQRYYFVKILLELIKNKSINDEFSNIDQIICIEEGNIDEKEYEDITIKINDKIISYQIKYKNEDNKTTNYERLKSIGFIKTFVNYFNNEYDLNMIENIYYVVSKTNGKNNTSNNFDILKNAEEAYKYLQKYTNEYIYNDSAVSKIVEKLKKIMNDDNKNHVIDFIKKIKIINSESYYTLKKCMNNFIKDICEITDTDLINYIRMSIIEHCTDKSFDSKKHVDIKNIKDIIELKTVDKKTNDSLKTKENELFLSDNDRIIELLNEEIASLKNNDKIKYIEEKLNDIHDEYKNNNNVDKNHESLYIRIRKLYAYHLLLSRFTLKKTKENDIIKFLGKVCYYYNHQIDLKINLESSNFNTDNKQKKSSNTNKKSSNTNKKVIITVNRKKLFN